MDPAYMGHRIPWHFKEKIAGGVVRRSMELLVFVCARKQDLLLSSTE
jgi:hypothetical protein